MTANTVEPNPERKPTDIAQAAAEAVCELGMPPSRNRNP